MRASSPGKVLCPSQPPVSSDMGQSEERGRTRLVLDPSLWALHPKGLIQLCVLPGASLHLTGALIWLKQLMNSHPCFSDSPFSPPARRGASKGSLAQGCGSPTPLSHACKEEGDKKCQRLPVSKGKINLEQGQAPAASTDVSREGCCRGCQRVSGSREGERGLCAAEPGTSLRRDRGRSAGLGAVTPTFLSCFGGTDTLRAGGWLQVLPWTPALGWGRGASPSRDPRAGDGSVTHPAAQGPHLPASKRCFPSAFVLFNGLTQTALSRALHIIFCQLFLIPQPPPAISARSEHPWQLAELLLKQLPRSASTAESSQS